MKYATKLMVVPYVTKQVDPLEHYMIKLDEEMNNILQRNDLNASEKLSLYNQALQKYLNADLNNSNKISIRNNEEDLKQKEENYEDFNEDNLKNSPRLIKKPVRKRKIKKELNKSIKKEPIKDIKKIKTNQDEIPDILNKLESMVIDDISSTDVTPPKIKTRMVPFNDTFDRIRTKSFIKRYNEPLRGDPTWRMSGKGSKQTKFVWKTKRFF